MVDVQIQIEALRIDHNTGRLHTSLQNRTSTSLLSSPGPWRQRRLGPDRDSNSEKLPYPPSRLWQVSGTSATVRPLVPFEA